MEQSDWDRLVTLLDKQKKDIEDYISRELEHLSEEVKSISEELKEHSKEQNEIALRVNTLENHRENDSGHCVTRHDRLNKCLNDLRISFDEKLKERDERYRASVNKDRWIVGICISSLGIAIALMSWLSTS